MSHFRIAQARYPDDPEILTNMAGALMTRSDFSEAAPHLERANQIDPNYPRLSSTSGLCSLRPDGRTRHWRPYRGLSSSFPMSRSFV